MKFPVSKDRTGPVDPGDPEAFKRIFQEYYPFIFAFIRRQVWSGAVAEDLVADCFLKLRQYAGRFKNQRAFKSWIFRVAKNLCLDYLKHERLEKQKVLESREPEMTEPVFDPHECHADLLKRIFKEVDNLPRHCRQIFLLYYRTHLSNREIAERLGVSEKTVYNQKAIAIKILRMKFPRMNSISMPVIMAVGWHFAGILSLCRW